MKDFFGTISFSQISSQATNNILGTYEQTIETNYRRAMELSNRLDPDKKFMWYLQKVAVQTTKLTSFIRSQSAEQIKYKQGLDLFKIDVVNVDIRVLKFALNNFQSIYEFTYREDRSKAIEHVNSVISIVVDIKNDMFHSPAYFEDENDAIEFYTSLYTMISNGLASVRMSKFYLSRILISEEAAMLNASFEYIPSIFYKNVGDQSNCTGEYKYITQILTDLGLKLRYASQKIFHWLQTKADSCASVTINSFLQTEKTTTITNEITHKTTHEFIDFITNNTQETNEYTTTSNYSGTYFKTTSSVSADYNTFPSELTTGDYDPTLYSFATTEIVGSVPGLWKLLSCDLSKTMDTEAYKADWMNTLNLINSFHGGLLTDCLLGYERMLYALGNDLSKQVPDAPEICVTNVLSTALQIIDNDVMKFNIEVYNYIINATSKAILADRAAVLLQNMSVDIEVALQSLSDMLTSWQNNVTAWQANTSSLYTNIISDLVEFSFYFPKDADFSSAVSSLKLWLKPTVIVAPNIAVKFTVASQELTKKSIASGTQKYLTYTAQTTMSSVLNNIVTTIATLGQTLVSQAQLMSSTWTTIRADLDYILDDFTSSMVLDDKFIQ